MRAQVARILAGLSVAAICYYEIQFIYQHRYAYDRIQFFFATIPVISFLWAYTAGTTMPRCWLMAYRGLVIGGLGWLAYEDYLTLANIKYIGGGILAALILDIVFRRRANRSKWFIDANGERQYVLAENRGHVIFNPITRKQRIIDEGVGRETRRKLLLMSGGVVVASILGWKLAWSMSDHLGAVLLAIFIAIAGALFAVLFIFGLIWEFVYQSGYQRMHGAKVLDPEPPPKPGLQQVRSQKVHGDAQLASPGEALDLLNGR